MSLDDKDFLKNEILAMQDQRIVSPIKSPWASPKKTFVLPMANEPHF
ncbi:12940_t:CDS:2 [Dentiscutata erythropus]|uniref:12940_t:CDS:1 n=1 Tax=Dentiscutata erythropus TaxID=1348616 RepID=A0A9N9CMP1_9GLOM|nr:12940_t:CDS:2 [Dentiscutata erythropus]